MKGLLVQLDRLAQVLLPLAPPSQFLEKAFGQLRGWRGEKRLTAVMWFSSCRDGWVADIGVDISISYIGPSHSLGYKNVKLFLPLLFKEELCRCSCSE